MEETKILEINLISAQGLKTVSTNLRRMQSYAIAWVDPSAKLRTRVDRLGSENPTWNDKFLFRVSNDFISGDTSAVSVEIFAVGYLKDFLVGTVRFLLSTCVTTAETHTGAPVFTAVQIRRPSGSFHGVLNIATAVYDSSDFPILTKTSAVSFRDMIGKEKREPKPRRGKISRDGSKRSEQSSGGESCDLSSLDLSDGADSTTSSSSAASTVLKEWNCVREIIGKKKGPKSDGGGGMLCGLRMQRKIPFCPSDQNLQFWVDAFDENDD